MPCMGNSYHRWLLGCVLLAGAFLACFNVLPATDLPQHLGMSALAWRLLHHDPAVAQLYHLNFQWTPYYLAYFILVPCVGLLGPMWGAKVALGMVAVAWLVALHMCLRQVRAPAALLVFGVFSYFNMLFYWGFVVMLVGVPFITLSVWGQIAYVQTRQRNYLGWAAAAAFMATLAHGILFLPIAATALALWAVAWRRNARPAAVVLGAGMAPLLGVVVEKFTTVATAPTGNLTIAHTSPALWLSYLVAHLGPLDGTWGSYAHGVAWLLILGAGGYVAWQGRRTNPGPSADAPLQRYLLLALRRRHNRVPDVSPAHRSAAHHHLDGRTALFSHHGAARLRRSRKHAGTAVYPLAGPGYGGLFGVA